MVVALRSDDFPARTAFQEKLSPDWAQFLGTFAQISQQAAPLFPPTAAWSILYECVRD